MLFVAADSNGGSTFGSLPLEEPAPPNPSRTIIRKARDNRALHDVGTAGIEIVRKRFQPVILDPLVVVNED